MRRLTSVRYQVETTQHGFQAVMDPIQIYKLIQNAGRNSARVDLYFSKSNTRLQSEVVDPAIKAPGITLRTPTGFRPSPADDECMAIVFLHGFDLLCIHSNRIIWQGDTFRLVPQWRAFTLQRRKQARLEIPAGYEILVDLDSMDARRRRVQRRVVDLSPGGMAFAAAIPAEAALYRKGLFLRHVAIRVEDRLIFADARVSQQASGKDTKVGIQFLRMNQGDKDFLIGYVARHLVQYCA